MRIQLYRPSSQQLDGYLNELQNAPFSYLEVGASKGTFPTEYLHSFDRFYLGQDKNVWEQAKELINNWEMFVPSWTFSYPATPPAAGREQAVCFRQFGFWWKSACRIIYIQDEPNHYGFAYGTLPTHVGSGEEYFGIERDEAGNCWFIIKAFSVPLFWGTRLFPFYMRSKQRAFIHQAGTRIQSLIHNGKQEAAAYEK